MQVKVAEKINNNRFMITVHESETVSLCTVFDAQSLEIEALYTLSCVYIKANFLLLTCVKERSGCD